jgi:hypothetical protein
LLDKLEELPKHGGALQSSAMGDVTGQAIHASGFANLAPDLLQGTLKILGPSPKDVVPLSLVCREWHAVMPDVWMELCMQSAGLLCEEFGYGVGSCPPGGWAGFYKFLVYCPGLVLSLEGADLNEDEQWPVLGHVERCISRFWTGGGLIRSLHFQERFKEDVVYMSSSCAHGVEREMGEPPTFACKGIVLDFLESEIAAACGAAAFVSARETRAIAARNSAELVGCPYCRGAVFDLDPRIFFMNQYDDLDDMVVASYENPRLTCTLGSVCENGHLFLASVGGAKRTKGLPIPASGAAVLLIRLGHHHLCEGTH